MFVFYLSPWFLPQICVALLWKNILQSIIKVQIKYISMIIQLTIDFFKNNVRSVMVNIIPFK